MASNTPVKVDPKQLVTAQELWKGFTQIGKWSIIAIVAIVVLLAVLFVPLG